MSSYQMALADAQRSGQPGKVVPTGGRGGKVSYKFVPTGGGSYSPAGTATKLQADFERREAEAQRRNQSAEAEIRGTYQSLIDQYKSGGAFKEAGLAEIEQAKTTEIGVGTQANISGGLFGTTVQGAMATQAENRASRSRIKLEDILQQRTNEARLGLANFVERIDRPYPDYNMLMQAMIAQNKA